MLEKILFVDDEENVTLGYKRSLRKKFQIDTAVGGEEGLRMLAEIGPYAVVVSDYKMPKMNGVEFLTKVKEFNADTVRVMLTGQAEMEAAIAAINEGSIFRFLNKPCAVEDLTRIINVCLDQYRLLTSERVLLQETLNGSAKVLIEILSSVNPLAFSRASRIKSYVRQIADKMGLENSWMYELAAMLSQIGCVSLPEDIIQRAHCGEELDEEEREIFNKHPEIGRDLIVNIPRLESVAEMIAGQMIEFSSLDDVDSCPISQGAQILKTVIDFDQLMGMGCDSDQAIVKMSERDNVYSPKIVAQLVGLRLASSESELIAVAAKELTNLMTIADDVYSSSGVLLVSRGQEVNYSLIERLKNFSKRVGIVEPISVYVKKA